MLIIINFDSVLGQFHLTDKCRFCELACQESARPHVAGILRALGKIDVLTQHLPLGSEVRRGHRKRKNQQMPRQTKVLQR